MHNMSAWTSVDDANHTRHCLRDCGHSETLSHEFDDGIVTKEPTINEEGVKIYTCEDCGYKKTEVLDKVSHSHDWSAWTDSGDNHTRTCQTAGCGATESLAHAWDEGVVTKEPTEDEKGIKTFTCSDCGKTREEPIAELGHEHSWGDWAADGEDNHSRTCTCGEKQSLPHSWDNGVVTKNPTETEEGTKTYTCSLCAQTKSEAISKLISKIENADTGVTLDVPTNSQASLPAGTAIDVVVKPVEEIPEQVLGEIAVTAEGAAKPLGMYDLSLLLDGAQIQPNGTVVVTLPAPDSVAEYDRIVVVYIASDGSYEECKTTVNEDGTISFETDHFSDYAVIGITAAESNSGLGVGAIVGIILGAIAVIGGGFCLYWFVIRKKINK